MKDLLPHFCIVVVFLLGVGDAFAQRTDPKSVITLSPGYPDALIDTGLSGVAEIDVTVKADGSVTNPELAMATHRAFGRAAMAALLEWKFKPGTKEDGTPVDRRIGISFHFQAPIDQQINAGAKRKVFVELPEPALSPKDYGAKLTVKQDARVIYPAALVDSGIEEKVQVKFVVTPEGTTVNPSVVGATHKEFEIPAMQAVAAMSYEPPKKGGKGVYVEAVTKLNFGSPQSDFGDDVPGGGRGPGIHLDPYTVGPPRR